MDKTLLYFGCIERAGHYLFKNSHQKLRYNEQVELSKKYSINENFMGHIDGLFTPPKYKSGYNVVKINSDIIVISWWDNTVDNRQGSNSNLIGIGYESIEEILNEANSLFDSVMKRQQNLQPYEPK
jgi:hypothetical protein